MNINIKILGLCIAIAIVGLSLENALTGHGIKGNKDLNPEVLATGSNSGSGSGSGNNSLIGPKYEITKKTLSEVTTTYTEGNQTCTKTVGVYAILCKTNAWDDCTPGTVNATLIVCFTPGVDA
jgi:hypothetical protein